MLYGTATMAILWAATRLFTLWPPGVRVPTFWPALLAAVLLAWTQALTWMPYPLPGFRVLATVLWLGVIDTVVLIALDREAREWVMVVILAPHIPLAYLTARVAVARARRSEAPDWGGLFTRLGPTGRTAEASRATFASAAEAQTWFEWRRHGKVLPALVAMVLPFELAALVLLTRLSPSLVYEILLGILFTPPLLAAFAVTTLRRTESPGRDAYGLTPFVATRPLTGAALFAAKLRMTIRSTLAAWLLVGIAIPLGLWLSGAWPLVNERAGRLIDVIGPARAFGIALLAVAALVSSTWKQLVQGLYLGLTGREWIVKSSVFLALMLLFILGPVALGYLENERLRALVWSALPWVAAVLVAIKISAAGWIATRLFSSRLVSERTLVAGAVGWLVTVLGLYGLLAWFFAAPIIPRHLFGLIAILMVPLARVSAAPLALAWNRHR
jgi:hypothetical protein